MGGDLRYAIRSLVKSPGFAFVAIGSLAVGIGANTAIFSLVDQLLLRLLPVKNPEQLAMLWARGPHYGSNTGSNAMSYPMYCDFRDRNKVFSGMFARYGTPFSMAVDGAPQRISGELVTGNFFPVLGVSAALGRVFTASDDLHEGESPYAVLSYSYWQTRFGGDRGVLGRKILLNNYPFTIVGVSQKGFDGIDPSISPEIRVPMTMKRNLEPDGYYTLSKRRGRFLNAFGRLRPGVTVEQAKAALQPLYHAIIEDEVRASDFAKATDYTRAQFLKSWMEVQPGGRGRSYMRRQYETPLWILLGVTGLVLLIACANLANLLIARAAGRQKEIAVRLAVGAGRWRLIGQLLTECGLLSLTGGVMGLLLAFLMDRALISFIPQGSTPLAIQPSPDLRVFSFAAAVSLATALLFGLVPALMATRPDLSSTLKDQAASTTGHSGFARKALVVMQVALSALLLIGSGLFVKTLRNLKDTDPGFQVNNLITFRVDAPKNGHSPAESKRIYRQIRERMLAAPGVRSAALAVVALLVNDEWDSTITVEGHRANPGEDMNPHMNYVSPGFFGTMGIGVQGGRDFSVRDDETAAKVAIVNEKFAKRYFPGQSALGRRIGMGGDPGTAIDVTIVGVVRDTRYEDMRTAIPNELYLPYVQAPFAVGITAYARTETNPSQSYSAMRSAVAGVDSNLPVFDMRTMEQQLDRSVSTESLVATLSTVFGVLATLLAAIGLYGVMSYSVARRTREIGIRMALGAAPVRVIWLVMREILVLVSIGLALGLAGAFGLTRYVQSQLYGVEPNDLLTIAIAVTAIAATALISGWAPVHRATRVQPMLALRWE